MSAVRNNTTAALVFMITICVLMMMISAARSQLQLGFYSRSCPNAERIVRKIVHGKVRADTRVAAKVLRLHFHDCFLQGCDGSILIKNPKDDDEASAPANAGLEGFDVIEEAKTELERACPRTVSCADILALAARDAVSCVRGPFYELPTGRRDGRVSKTSLAATLPEVDDSIEVLKSKFRQKGLSERDLLLLSGGAHTIGTTACFFMKTRLYEFNNHPGSDLAINPRFLRELQARCPHGGDVNVRIPLDWRTPNVFDDEILRNIKNGFAVLSSDARLYDDNVTRLMLDSYVSTGRRRRRASFRNDFADAMVRMGNIQVKTGSKGEIRRVCHAIN